MIEVRDSGLDKAEVKVVTEYLKNRGTEFASLYRGNGCVWVSSGAGTYQMNEYFILRDNKIVDIVID